MSDKPKKKITWKQWQRRTMLIILAVVACELTSNFVRRRIL